MAPRDQGKQGRGEQWRQQDEGRGSQTQGERGGWRREGREQSWRPDYRSEATGQGGRDEGEWEGDGSRGDDRYRSGGRDEPYRGDPYDRDRYDRDRSQGEYGGGQPGHPRREETWSDLNRWERTPLEGPSYGGGAYAGGSMGGGAYGPGGFGKPARSGHWPAAGGGGTNHAGRGPKGYQRSDARITEDVCEALTRHPDIDATEISVRCEKGEIVLSGTVNDRREKRMAEDAAEEIAGVADVRNEIRVNRSNSTG